MRYVSETTKACTSKSMHQIMSLISVFYADYTVEADIKRHMASREEHSLLNVDGRVYNK